MPKRRQRGRGICQSTKALTAFLETALQATPGLSAGAEVNSMVFLLGIRVLLAGLTPAGVAHSWVLGTLVYSAFGLGGYVLVCLYFIFGSAVTKVRLAQKQKEGIAEARSGRRSPGSVWGSGLAGTVCAACALVTGNVALWRIGFVASFVSKLSDTVSSEIGKAYGRTTYLATTLQRVPRGTEGAVSAEGTAAGLAAAIAFAALAAALGQVTLADAAVVAAAATAANLFESLLGAAVQGRVTWLSNDAVNALQISVASALAYQYRPGTISEYISSLLARHAKRRRRRKPVRVYMDGCFDMMHYGHANAMRQAKGLGDELVLGLIPDSEILMAKGPPVMNDAERKTMVESVKWVDEVIEGVPYELGPEFLAELFSKHAIDYVVHGDDPCLLPDGSDAYAYAKKQGRFRMIKRTEGVSSTDIVGRMLMCTRDNARFREDKRELTKQFSQGRESSASGEPADGGRSQNGDGSGRKGAATQHTLISRFMPTSRRIVQFSDGRSAPPDARIVYIDGAFDLFHPGHVQILKAARAAGDFLLVGLHSDEDVRDRRGPHLPIMDLHERALSVLACCHVNEVIIGAPLELTEDLLTTFNIAHVVRGSVTETGPAGAALAARRYAAAHMRGIFQLLPSPSDMTTATIIHRIVHNRAQYEARNAKKAKSEAAYYSSQKTFVQEG
ncbi:hypothetical protein WJX81_006957 [Elliptochloris bilobata]|uniref:ethanolamine-phosphate cytidylyltransferase n=1 Tax=Elliptochloris bilobata TaxID=381761 RepID=A0AAW1RGD2_9CHLO